MAADDGAIVSANVVGYQDQAMPDGSTSAVFKMVTPTFANVGGGTEININDFKVKNSEDYKTTIQLMDASGQWDPDKESTWFNDYYEDETLVAPAGWYTADGLTQKDFTIAQGDAVFLTVAEQGVAMTSAGEVAGEYTRPLPGNTFSMVGNSTPVKQSVNAFKVNNSADYMTSIQLLNDEGQWDADKESTWFNDYYVEETLVAPAGWYTADGLTMREFDLEPGESMFLTTQEEGVTLTIPAAIQ